jgi:hypothetical protein
VIEYLDLVGRPHSTMDCKAVVSTALRRMGHEVDASLWLGRAELWRPVLGVPREGDVILSHPDGRPHVAVIVSTVARICLSSDARQGVHVLPLSAAMADRTGVYRLRGQQ